MLSTIKKFKFCVFSQLYSFQLLENLTWCTLVAVCVKIVYNLHIIHKEKTGTLKRKKHYHNILDVGSANSAKTVSESDINISGVEAITEISSGNCSQRKYC